MYAFYAYLDMANHRVSITHLPLKEEVVINKRLIRITATTGNNLEHISLLLKMYMGGIETANLLSRDPITIILDPRLEPLYDHYDDFFTPEKIENQKIVDKLDELFDSATEDYNIEKEFDTNTLIN